ncbi:MAG: Hsp20/alpha crystallin family protein [Deltaproteobacteria bacterium]|jgi:HSP20 family protein|nr:Hsp20/alpha crystallin family protein [Deltaproteobacteria bacterium]MDA8306661.1 Hsp20/alpha crystallin family protein [Deltaproteobacteria bacterium]
MAGLIPFRDFERCLVDVPAAFDLVDDFFAELAPFFADGRRDPAPEFDISETGEHIVIRADIPGIDLKDLEIEVDDRVLTLKGNRKEEREEKTECFHRAERRFGSFSRSFRLPDDVEADKIEAVYKDGVVKVTVPKGEGAKPKKVEVKAN